MTYDIDEACEEEARRILETVLKRRYPALEDIESLTAALKVFSIKVAANLTQRHLHQIRREGGQQEMIL